VLQRNLDVGGRSDFPIVIATTPASTRQRKIALGALIVLGIMTALAVRFSNIRSGEIAAFVPVVQTAMCVADLLTAVLLFTQYSVYPQRALLTLASGFVFSGLFAFLQTLAFPGAYGPVVLIGDALNSASWLFLFWHTTFPLTVIFYTLWKDAGVASNRLGPSTGVTIGVTVVCVVAATASFTWIATAGVHHLPRVFESAIQRAPFFSYISLFLSLLTGAALALLFVRKRTVLDYWLIVTLLAWLPNFVMADLLTDFRFSLGWYIARIYAMCAGCALLFALLAELIVLHTRLAASLRVGAQQQRDLSAAVTELEQSKQSLEQVNLWFHTALKNMTQGLSMFDKDQRLILCNHRYGEIYRLTPNQVRPGTTLRSILESRAALGSRPDYDHIEERLRLVRSPQPVYDENRLHDGRVIAVNFQPMPDGGWVAVHQEITERKRIEDHQKLLISELDHRVKNILARVAMVAKYTGQGSRSIDEFIRALDSRIQSIADAHTLLSQSHWRGVGLAELVRRQLAPYTTNTNTAISGPNVILSPTATQALAMVLQELATNAVKYGSLSTQRGKVSVSWERRLAEDGAARVMIAWREIGGPSITAARHSSYGINLIRNLIPHELGGTVDLVFASDGLRCDIAIPLEECEQAA
jgi:two-component sensor histidine kinase/PAS domain-containing protein